MHAVGVPVLPAVFCDLPARKEQEKARKGKDLLQGREREQRQRQTKSKEIDSLHPTLRTSRDGAKHDVAHRKANQPDHERKARSTSTNEAKHVDERSKARRRRSKARRHQSQAWRPRPKQSTTSLMLKFAKSFFFPSLRRSRRRRGAPGTGLQCVREPGDCGGMSP